MLWHNRKNITSYLQQKKQTISMIIHHTFQSLFTISQQPFTRLDSIHWNMVCNKTRTPWYWLDLSSSASSSLSSGDQKLLFTLNRLHTSEQFTTSPTCTIWCSSPNTLCSLDTRSKTRLLHRCLSVKSFFDAWRETDFLVKLGTSFNFWFYKCWSNVKGTTVKAILQSLCLS